MITQARYKKSVEGLKFMGEGMICFCFAVIDSYGTTERRSMAGHLLLPLLADEAGAIGIKDTAFGDKAGITATVDHRQVPGASLLKFVHH